MRSSRPTLHLLPILGSLACATTPQSSPSTSTATAASVVTASSSANWPSYNGSIEGTRYSSLSQITPANASTLERGCTFDTGEQMSMQSGPVVVNGVLAVSHDRYKHIRSRCCDLQANLAHVADVRETRIPEEQSRRRVSRRKTFPGAWWCACVRARRLVRPSALGRFVQAA